MHPRSMAKRARQQGSFVLVRAQRWHSDLLARAAASPLLRIKAIVGAQYALDDLRRVILQARDERGSEDLGTPWVPLRT